jgi:exopolyphosphatase / guanosine-5'-triphosphate,3'-diphosphate pyrophosphatase
MEPGGPYSTKEIVMQTNHLAVLDLGSNSFHMVVAFLDKHSNLQILDKLKDRSRLAAGLDQHKQLTIEAQEKALTYLRKYSERLKDFKTGCVRCVATDTFRKAKNGQEFLEVAEQTLGWPIEIISGIEEARLIYKGVSHDYPSNQKRLVIDIGGGSTELVIGIGSNPIELASSRMGCVSWTQRFFPDEQFTPEHFTAAIDGSRRVLSSYVRKYRDTGWHEAIGTSGTIRAISDILLELNRSDGSIAISDLIWLSEKLIALSRPEEISWKCISESRREVLAGGVCILLGVMQALHIQKIRPVNNALREGVLIEMVGRMFGDDIREQTIQAMVDRFSINTTQSDNIERTATHFFNSVQDEWGLNEEDKKLLQWATRVHEIGLSISFKGYHRHGGYIIKNADLAGFSRPQQTELSMLVYSHRGKIKRDELRSRYPNMSQRQCQLIAILRIATRLHRRRSPTKPPLLPISVDNNHLQLTFPIDYLQNKPLTNADLMNEVIELAKLGIELDI